MRKKKISDVMDNISTKYVDEAICYQGKTKTSNKVIWYKWGAVAACFVLLVLGGIKIIPILTGGTNLSQSEQAVQGKYKYHVIGEDVNIEWTWEYKTLGEKYQTVIYDGNEYSIKSLNPISRDVLGQSLGTGEAEGIDSYTDTKYTELFEIYEIKGISENKLMAAGIDGEIYVYRSIENTKPDTFGELMTDYTLNENLEFNKYTTCNGYEEKGYYTVNDDAYIWEILSECNEAVLVDSEDSPDKNNRNYLSFTVTSDALGVYKRVVYISEDGYFETNIFDYSYTYFIGVDAAEKIIKYVNNNSKTSKFEEYESTVSGKLVEIGANYVLIDDSVLCRNQEDGTVYKVNIDDIRIKRCVDCAEINVGDIVVVKYNGEITKSNDVTGAYSIYEGTLVDMELGIEE